MNQNFMKSTLLVSVCMILGCICWPQIVLASPKVTIKAVQQGQKISGHVADQEGPVIGASIVEKGYSANGTVTDLDGNFILTLKGSNPVIIVSYIGYKTQTITIGNRSQINVMMSADNKTLDEVVVMGYGVQKKKLVTGATDEIKGSDIEKLNTTQVLGALQSQSPGVNITAISGQPGDGYKVAIRGAGTNSNTKPIYVIDGVTGGDINNLNPADIERIDVLKDAASCAIYGSNGANGVILITTKQGKQGKIQVSYDGNVGWSNVYKMPQLLNAKQYMAVQDLVNYNNGGQAYDWSKYINADLLKAYQDGSNEGTNWLDAIRNKNAMTTNQAINIIGGTDRSKFSSGVGYQYQDGIFGNVVKSDFRRFTLRLNSEHVIYSNPKGLDVVKVGENVYFQHKENQGIQIGNQYSNAISDMLRANPCIPIYDQNGNYTMHDYLASSGTEGWFNYNSYTSNPIASLVNSQSGNNKSKNFSLNAIGYVEIQPIKDLVYKGQINYNQSSYTWRAYLPEYYINDSGGSRTQDQVTEQVGTGWGWSTTNTLNYKFNIVQSHHFDVLLGTEYSESRPNFGEMVEGTSTGSIYGDFKHAYLSLTKNRVQGATVSGTPYGDSRNMSYFSRVNYDYNETYMLSAILRADGSSVFAPDHRWGYFPSVSGGWVVTNEKFMAPTSKWLDFLKIRAGWGQNGNRNIVDAFAYQATFAYNDYSNYSFGNTKNSYTQGASPSRLANEDLTWETSDQTDIGLDARFLKGKMGFTFDWYKKVTKDLLIQVPVASTTGFSTQWKNAGTVQNTGIEVALDWHDKVGSDFTYGANWNLAYNKNKVTKINSSLDYIEGGNDNLAQNTGYMARMQVGHPIGYFYGYKTGGVIQNASDLQSYIQENCGGNAANSLQGSSLKPGDLKFVDTNHDGKITTDDKTDLGNPIPDVTMGFGLNCSYKGADLSVTAYAALGQQVARSWRKFTDGQYENYTTEVYEYWNGEGTSNKYPMIAPGNTGVNWQAVSDIYIENASYLRLQNITLGYDFKHIWKGCPFGQLRLYVTAQNLFTITGYKGMDPENGMALNSAEPWVTGVDVGNYPQPRTYLVGVNIKF
ncbi:MAG: TonB-dependent receptor [Prevotella sp.]|jgi:TonB-linked SusC/RagA family outer membrane protein|uniref:TonB-dependent receptor n=1 Tax=Segatella cerevisiae TaxID=2053716 RepID=A0ABT1BZP4_9BACT|nr:TonB-dependent receptor [Segatella cerevisiae]MCH3993932.1 TonB-dependent receptor [Prevotella sp.]MCI1246480.1 TonB-dependent receptor [Prevotella sp.]MCO6026561.1 TonB-dependent receptor [Segatella cerevisiae]